MNYSTHGFNLINGFILLKLLKISKLGECNSNCFMGLKLNNFDPV